MRSLKQEKKGPIISERGGSNQKKKNEKKIFGTGGKFKPRGGGKGSSGNAAWVKGKSHLAHWRLVRRKLNKKK